MPSELHIGKKIKEVWKNSGLKGSEFADLLHRQRQSIYHLFKQKSINTLLLRKISLILKHDFFEDYSKDLATEATEPANTIPETGKPIRDLSQSIRRLSKEVSRLAKKTSDSGP